MTLSSPLAGYRDGLRQQSTILMLSAEINNFVGFELLDEWLNTTFEIDKEAFLDCPPLDGSQLSIMTAWSWRVLELGAAFLRGLAVPAFEKGRVLEVLPPEGTTTQYSFRCLIPFADHVAGQLFALAYQKACDLSFWMMAAKPTAGNLERLFDRLQDELIKPLAWAVHWTDMVIPLLRAAWHMEVPYRHLAAGFYQLGWGAKAVRTAGGAVQFDSAFGAIWANDKRQAAVVMRDAGLPGPEHLVAINQEQALAAAQSLGWPLVVKPTNQERGEGVSVDIADETQLLSAFQVAAKLSREVLIERQVPGVCHRIMVANGKVWVVSKRKPKGVEGDGRQTVRQLVMQANKEQQAKPQWARLKPFPLDYPAMQCLAAEGLTPDSVPADGQFVPLRRIQSTADGGVVDELTEVIHSDNVAVALKAARLFGLSMAGIDMISTDITKPWHETDAIINEVNFSQILPFGKKTMTKILSEYFSDDGRIPIEVVVGGETALADGLKIRAAHAERGLRTFLTSHDRTIGDDGESVALTGATLFERCIALMADSRVDAMVVVVQNDDLLATGLPFDRIASITSEKGVAEEWMEPVLAMLKPFQPKPAKQKTAGAKSKAKASAA